MDKVNFVSVERVRDLLISEVEKANYIPLSDGSYTGGMHIVAFGVGLNQKVVSDIIHLRRTQVSVTTLDKILTGLDLEYLSNWGEELGGFNDVYDNLQPPKRKKKYKYKAKTKDECPECGGEKSLGAKVCAGCRYSKTERRTHCKECNTPLAKDGRGNKTGLCGKCYGLAGGGFTAARMTEGTRKWARKSNYIIKHGMGYDGVKVDTKREVR